MSRHETTYSGVDSYMYFNVADIHDMTFIRVHVYDVTCLLFTFWVLHSVLLWLMHAAYDNSLSM